MKILNSLENIKGTLQTLKDDIAEPKKLYNGEETQIARLENMEKVISDYEENQKKIFADGEK